MTKKKRAKRVEKLVPAIPAELDEKAALFWPSLSVWPTSEDVASFVDGTRLIPDVRLSVLSGLRSYSATNVQPVWSFVATWIALSALAITVAIPQSPEWVRVVSALLFAVIGWIAVAKLADMHGEVDQRTRGAIVWLAAFEDGLKSEQNLASRGKSGPWWNR